MTTMTITERVARGAALLDQVNSGWESRINLDKLDIKQCASCVLGQLYGGYDAGAGALGISPYGEPSTVNLGFWGDPVKDTPNQVEVEYRDLGVAWAKVIEERLEMRALEAEAAVSVEAETKREKVDA